MERSQAKALIEALEGGEKDLALRRRYNEALTEGNLSGVVRDVKNRLNGGAVFTEDDYNSGDGFQTFIWGPCVWTFLHIVSMNYRPERKEEYRAFLAPSSRSFRAGTAARTLGATRKAPSNECCARSASTTRMAFTRIGRRSRTLCGRCTTRST